MQEVDMYKLDMAIKLLEEVRQGMSVQSNVSTSINAPVEAGNSRRAKPRKEPFPYEILNQFQYQEDKTISHLLDQIHAPTEGLDIKKISPQTITGWLKNAGYLTVEYCADVHTESTMPTEKGRNLGIYSEIRTYGARSYVTVIYNRQAQEFIVEHFETIVNGEVVEESYEHN